MNGYLIDTNVLSEFGKTQPPEPTVKQWMETADPASLFASVITWGEMRKEIESKPPADRRPGLEQWLERDLRDWFQSRLLPVTKTIVDRWGVLAGQSKLKGMALTMADGLILATALEHNLVVVTRNVKDFTGHGAAILAPWEVRTFRMELSGSQELYPPGRQAPAPLPQNRKRKRSSTCRGSSVPNP